jgi:hypothetical protein
LNPKLLKIISIIYCYKYTRALSYIESIATDFFYADILCLQYITLRNLFVYARLYCIFRSKYSQTNIFYISHCASRLFFFVRKIQIKLHRPLLEQAQIHSGASAHNQHHWPIDPLGEFIFQEVEIENGECGSARRLHEHPVVI